MGAMPGAMAGEELGAIERAGEALAIAGIEVDIVDGATSDGATSDGATLDGAALDGAALDGEANVGLGVAEADGVALTGAELDAANTGALLGFTAELPVDAPAFELPGAATGAELFDAVEIEDEDLAAAELEATSLPFLLEAGEELLLVDAAVFVAVLEEGVELLTIGVAGGMALAVETAAGGNAFASVTAGAFGKIVDGLGLAGGSVRVAGGTAFAAAIAVFEFR